MSYWSWCLILQILVWACIYKYSVFAFSFQLSVTEDIPDSCGCLHSSSQNVGGECDATKLKMIYQRCCFEIEPVLITYLMMLVLQSTVVGSCYKVIQDDEYDIVYSNASTVVQHEFELTKVTLYLFLMGELGDVYCEDLGGKWLCFNSIIPYMYMYHVVTGGRYWWWWDRMPYSQLNIWGKPLVNYTAKWISYLGKRKPWDWGQTLIQREIVTSIYNWCQSKGLCYLGLHLRSVI